ncbi:hypothetical protein WA026_004183 [Henosepilachna vigintioctopunctata]|uniref:Uncharacterized protein n=1 Tax=Henosepilachna vigintioctopunctata TaxID=420089 RepID=A0AAW1UGM8_9CUCU
MADKESQVKEVEATVEEVDKSKAEEVVPEKEKAVEANGDAENGSDEKDSLNENDEKNGHEDETDKVCSIKRKSTGGDAKEDAPAEGVTPEKKAKIDEPAEAESNGDAAEVAA